MAETVKDVMSTDLKSVEPGASVADAAGTMREAEIGAILVVEDDELRGVLTDRDIVVGVIAEGKDPGDVEVRELASTDLQTLSPDDSLDDALRTMREQKVRRLPVVDDGKPVGIVTLGDIAAEREPESALGEISAAPPDDEGGDERKDDGGDDGKDEDEDQDGGDDKDGGDDDGNEKDE